MAIAAIATHSWLWAPVLVTAMILAVLLFMNSPSIL